MKLLSYALVLCGISGLPIVASADRYDRYDGHHWDDRSGERASYGYHRDGDRWHRGQSGYGHQGFEKNRPGSFANQEIASGARSGELTPRELQELRARERDIEQTRYAASADGRISKSERHELNDKINDFQKDLNHNLNDGEHRNGF